MLYAYRRYDSRLEKDDYYIELSTVKPDWVEEDWICVSTPGEASEHPVRIATKGVRFAHHFSNARDAHLVSPEDEAELFKIENEIQRLEEERRQLLSEKFHQWRQITVEDCARVVPGKTKQECEAEIKERANLRRKKYM